jgi:hypothetical protein
MSPADTGRKAKPDNTSGNNKGPLTPRLAPSPENTLSVADPGLARLVAAWPDLPPHIKAAVLALLDAAR